MYRIAIQPDDQLLFSGRRQSFSSRWIECARQAGHEVRVVDAYSPDFFDQVAGCDGFLWWFAHLPRLRNFARRLLPAVEHGMGIPVFPNWRTCWHFDDKLAQRYLLEAAGIPTPRTWVFWRRADALAFCRRARYPLVIKLASGIVSENVRLITGVAEAEYWVGHLFGAGLTALKWPIPPRAHRALARVRAAARLLVAGRPPATPTKRNDLQRGYLLVQEFLAGNAFDTRVTVIGHRAFAFRRFNRPNDFRASGSGRIDFDPAQVDAETVRLAFRVAQSLGTQSLAVDVLRRGGDAGEPVIVEISYYYEGWALHECPGHWALHGDAESGRLEWVEGHVRPEDAIMEDFLARLGLASVLVGASPRS